MGHAHDSGRLRRRALGLAAFGLFLAGLLIALDLEELVVLAVALAALCAVAGGVTWLVVRFRRHLARGAVGAFRLGAPAVARGARAAGRGGHGAGVAAHRAAHGAMHRAAQGAARRLGPVLRRVDAELAVAARRAAAAGKPRLTRVLAAVARDIHGGREAVRDSGSYARPRGRREVPIPVRSPGARRRAARPSAEERRRGRA